MDQSIVVSLEKWHYDMLMAISEEWNKRPEEILKLICEKAIKTAVKNLEKS